MKFARQRDENEAEIVKAMRAIGAAVAKLEGTGVPDLVVSYNGVLTLVEVKCIKVGAKRAHKGKHDDEEHRELTPAQVTWWARWEGKPVIVVHNIAEALAAIGATT